MRLFFLQKKMTVTVLFWVEMHLALPLFRCRLPTGARSTTLKHIITLCVSSTCFSGQCALQIVTQRKTPRTKRNWGDCWVSPLQTWLICTQGKWTKARKCSPLYLHWKKGDNIWTEQALVKCLINNLFLPLRITESVWTNVRRIYELIKISWNFWSTTCFSQWR